MSCGPGAGSAPPESARTMSHGGLPITASKPACGARSVRVEEHLGKLELPVKEAPGARGRFSVAQLAVDDHPRQA